MTTYASKLQSKSTNFYVPKLWHFRFIGDRGRNIKHVINSFKVEIKVPPRESPSTSIEVKGDREAIEATKNYYQKILGFMISEKPLVEVTIKLNASEISRIISHLKSSSVSFPQFCSKHGVVVSFPKKKQSNSNSNSNKNETETKGNTDTYIQGSESGVSSAVKELSSIIKKQLTTVAVTATNVSKPSAGGTVKNKRRRKRYRNAHANAVSKNNALFFHPFENDKYDFERFLDYLMSAESSLDICVFTITDNRIRNVIVAEFESGTKVRIVSDNSQAECLGSDVGWLAAKKIPVKVDYDPHGKSHMHHKFCVIDRKLLLTGSFNWTRHASADEGNYENILITSDELLVKRYQQYFDDMWSNDQSIIDYQQYIFLTKN